MNSAPRRSRIFTELAHRRPRTWIPDVERLHALMQAHGAAALRTAFERGLAEQAIGGVEYIAHSRGDDPTLPFADTVMIAAKTDLDALSSDCTWRMPAGSGAR